MKRFRNILAFSLALATLLFVSSCQQPGGNKTGSEYMPDMAHSIAYEANVYNYYQLNTWGSEDDYYKSVQPRIPVNGTIPRSSRSISGDEVHTYPYGDTDEERTRAINEIVENPFKITDAGLAVGKNLYDINCGICHGAKADGNGYLVRDDGGVYPVQPAIMTSDEFVSASNGRYYHSIIYGKNLMGGYADKLNYEERWQVIHYIRSLQAKDRGVEYNQMVNTLNSIDEPAGEIVKVADAIDHEHDHSNDHDAHEGDEHTEDNHGHEHH